MRKILLLGAGLVTGPLVTYLLNKGYHLTIGTLDVERAEAMVAGHPGGTVLALDIVDSDRLDGLIAASDQVVSLLPYLYHVQIAERCIALKKNMVTTSYVSPAMKALDAAAREAGVLLLNEMGVDPGLDHMSAMRVIDRVRGAGGAVRSFRSCTGGLPAPPDNDNSWGYKFSWSPRGVLLAGRNPAKWIEDGTEVQVPGEELFLHHWPLEIPGVGILESYPNRDSTEYITRYGLEGVETIFRGTLRYPGWCVAIKQLVDLGWLDIELRDDLQGRTYAELMWRLVGRAPAGDLRAAIAGKLGVDVGHDGIGRMASVGLLGDEVVSARGVSYLDALCELLERRLVYAEGERDMIAMVHAFDVVEADGTHRSVTSTLVDYGIPHGDSSMSRCVALPAAIGTHRILTGEIQLTGVHVPVIPAIYEPVLAELETLGINVVEHWG